AKSLGWEIPPEREGTVGFGRVEHVLDAIEGALDGRDFIASDRFSAADLYLASHLGWGMGFGTVEKRPTFERYVALHDARPAAKRASEIDDALIAAQQQPAE
ncbi:MAG TPA: glutathione S-transferase C-terminal domain-containing protein, partial [Phenylobacterium sp.]|nr:glutathione S-transferase C-terminal domain-containing protein [Phenylobacterium sp.]